MHCLPSRARRVQRQGQECAVRTRAIVAERPAHGESRARIQCARGGERRHRPGLQTEPAQTTTAGHPDEVLEHRAADAASSRLLGSVHRLELGVAFTKLLQRSYAEQLPVEAAAEECESRIEQPVGVQCVGVLRRAVRTSEGEVTRQQLANVRGPWIVDRDLRAQHIGNLPIRTPAGQRCLQSRVVIITAAGEMDWPQIYPIFAAIVAAGQTYAYPENLSLADARPWWMEPPPGQTVVALEGGTVLGAAKMGPNRPGRGSHVATASFMVAPAHGGEASAAPSASTSSTGRKPPDIAASSSTRWSRPITSPSTFGRHWAFKSSPPFPGAFEHREHGLVGLHVMFKQL